eukprot:m.190818 g.190818  ORF g.190818 m.190818 type:complete len:50 (+) comp24898_c1_seq2:1802-1951(+)
MYAVKPGLCSMFLLADPVTIPIADAAITHATTSMLVAQPAMWLMARRTV